MSGVSCFVISPIGSKDSDARKNADDLFELIIQPALEKFDVEVTRADKISSVGSITSEVISLVQESDICIIDITGHNPNVMYECGRRHETGKPYIMIAREGEALPFDITTIRTIFYDLTKPREIRAVVISIQEICKKFIQQGFSAASAGDSLASLSEAIRRIERTLNSMTTSGSIQPFNAPPTGSNALELLKKLGAADAIIYALSQKDPDLLDELLPRIRNRVDGNVFRTSVLPRAAAIGSRVAVEMLKPTVLALDSFSVDDQQQILGGYLTGMGAQNREAEALAELSEFFDAVSRGELPKDGKPNERAFFLNQKQRLLHGLARFEEAVALGEQVLALCPNDASYIFNQCINYESIKDDKKGLQLADRLMALILSATDSIPDDDHLERVIRTYARAGLKEKVRDAFRLLAQHHPLKAAIVGEQRDIERALHS